MSNKNSPGREFADVIYSSKFQVAYDLPDVGRVGPLTLAKLNAVIASGQGLDISAPVMSNLLVQTNTTSATVTWNTDELSRVKVFYSTNPIAESEASQSFTEPTIPAQFVTPSYALQTSQSVSLTNLVSKTTYYYIAESIDQSGNVTVSNQSSFTTN